jgi:hypothetical protein
MAILFFIITRRWTAIYGFITAAALATAYTLFTIGYTEHYFYTSSILPILLQENPITDAENISVSRLLLLTNIDIHYLKPISKVILLLPLIFCSKLIKATEAIGNNLQKKQAYVLIFSMFIPFTLAGMNNTLWNYQILLTLPLTAMACILLNNFTHPKEKKDALSLFFLLFILLILHVTAAMTVDDEFYSSGLVKGISALVSRILVAMLIIFSTWRLIHLISASKSPR